VWLLGHQSGHLIEDGFGHVKVTDLHRALIDAGLPVLWVNPLGLIGTGYRQVETFRLQPSARESRMDLAVDQLDECVLTRAGFVTPTLRDIHSDADVWSAQQAAEAASLRAAQSRRQETESAQRREQARQARILAEADAARPAQVAAWLTDPLRQQLLVRHGGHMPNIIAKSTQPEDGVLDVPERWHAIVCRDLLDASPGRQFTVNDAYVALARAGVHMNRDPLRLRDTVTAYLARLHLRGLISIQFVPGDSRSIEFCTVICDPVGYATRRQQNEVRDRELRAQAKIADEEEAAALREAESTARAATLRASKWDAPLNPEWDGGIRRVQSYVPGTEVVLRWHVHVISALRDSRPPVEPTVRAVRADLEDLIGEVPDEDVDQFLKKYRERVQQPPVNLVPEMTIAGPEQATTLW
jgi:hypothetical protein